LTLRRGSGSCTATKEHVMRFSKPQLVWAVAAGAVAPLAVTLLVIRGVVEVLLMVCLGAALVGLYWLRRYARAEVLYSRHAERRGRRSAVSEGTRDRTTWSADGAGPMGASDVCAVVARVRQSTPGPVWTMSTAGATGAEAGEWQSHGGSLLTAGLSTTAVAAPSPQREPAVTKIDPLETTPVVRRHLSDADAGRCGVNGDIVDEWGWRSFPVTDPAGNW
jgi:hypothetical protein